MKIDRAGVGLCAMMFCWAAIAHQPDGRSKETWYREDGRSYLALYASGRAFVRPEDSDEVAEYAYEVQADAIKIIAADGTLLLPAALPTPNTLVLELQGRTRAFHRISGDWLGARDGSAEVLRLSPRYLTAELYRPDGPWQGDYRYDGKTLRLVEKSGAAHLAGAVELHGEEMLFGGIRYRRLSDYVDSAGLIAKRSFDGTEPTIKGQWADPIGRIWKFANEYFELTDGGHRVLVGLYAASGDRLELRSSSLSEAAFELDLRAALLDANTLEISGDGGAMTLYYQGDFNITIGMYDIDKYRVPSDYFRTRPYGGYQSWCISCDDDDYDEATYLDMLPRGGTPNYRSEWVPYHRQLDSERARWLRDREEEARRRRALGLD